MMMTSYPLFIDKFLYNEKKKGKCEIELKIMKKPP